ncbi:hypothetical protein ACQVP2_28260 [Methylobacterium aquaticum]|uniref:hypothetical protein n=1 Tax=Methylobacterium aquaticum TaxID=270351 RepID=UPI003D167FD2
MSRALKKGAGDTQDQEKPRRGKAPGLKKSPKISSHENSAPAPKNKVPGSIGRSREGITVGSFMLFDPGTSLPDAAPGVAAPSPRPSLRDAIIARKRVAQISRLLRHRHQGQCRTDDAEHWFETVLPHLLLIAATRPIWCMNPFRWAQRFTPELHPSRVAVVIAEARRFPSSYTSEEIGRRLMLKDAEREALKLTHLWPVDLEREEHAGRQKAKDAIRKKRARAAAGATPRERSLAALKPWEAEQVSRRTWYRRQAHVHPD